MNKTLKEILLTSLGTLVFAGELMIIDQNNINYEKNKLNQYLSLPKKEVVTNSGDISEITANFVPSNIYSQKIRKKGFKMDNEFYGDKLNLNKSYIVRYDLSSKSK